MAEDTEETASYEKKKFIDYSGAKPNSFQGVTRTGVRLEDLSRGGSAVGATAEQIRLAQELTARGLGNLSIDQFAQSMKRADFVEKYDLGKTYSYKDLALEALQGDPNFDPEDTEAVSKFAQDLEQRGFKLKDREKIQGLAVNQSVQDQIDRATNPGKYLTEEQKAANLDKVNQLITQTFGGDPGVPGLSDFLAEQMASGQDIFELSQFLQTTPQFLEKKAAQDREAINTELLASEEEVFKKALPSIMSSYMKAGRLDSSGVDNAVARARGELANIRQGMLTGYAREDVVGARNAAFQNYLRQSEPGYQQQFAVQGAGNYAKFQAPWDSLNRQYALNDQATARRYALQDYNMQRNDFNRYLAQSQASDRSNAMYGLLGNVLGSGLDFGSKYALQKSNQDFYRSLF